MKKSEIDKYALDLVSCERQLESGVEDPDGLIGNKINSHRKRLKWVIFGRRAVGQSIREARERADALAKIPESDVVTQARQEAEIMAKPKLRNPILEPLGEIALHVVDELQTEELSATEALAA